MNGDELAALTAGERQALIETLEALTDDQWLTPSLCEDWRVVDVAAHLAWAPVMGVGEGLAAMARHGFSMNRVIARSAVGWSTRGRDAILDQLRHNRDSDAKPIGMPTVAALADAVVHGIDVRRPLGLVRPIPADVLEPVAGFALRTRWPMNSSVGGSARRRVDGVRLVASDVDWSHGSGPEVRAPAQAVAMLLYGRHPSTEELTGPGARVLRPRL